MSDDPTKTLLFETSPFGTLDAIVEHDGRVVYFYLNEHPDESGKTAGKFGTRACWLGNLERGPLVMDQAEMAQGLPPLMPRNDCVNQEPIQVPQSEDLEIVWFEEGNGAAVLQRDESTQKIVAVIPPWSGIDGFHGYALNAVHETPLAWPLPPHDALNLRVQRAAAFWSSFTNESSPFSSLQQQLLELYDSHFGAQHQQKYYAIDGGQFPPRGLVRYETPTETILLTVGMSLCPQPSVELSVEHPSAQRRIELAVRIAHGDDGPDLEQVDATMRSLSSWAGYPWRNHGWLGQGHTIDFLASGSKEKLVRDEDIELATFRDDPIGLLWIQ